MIAAQPRACAVVGAGAAGLAAARVLQQQGHAVTLFDKGRRVGGRMAVRETAHGVFDHGAPGFMPRAAGFVDALQQPCELGHAAPWPAAGAGAITGVPTVQALASYWCDALDVRCSHHVESIRPINQGFALYLQGDSQPHRFDAVIVTVPQPQLKALLPDLLLPRELTRIVYDPCWTLLWTPATASLPPATQIKVAGHASIDTVIREDLKPGRCGPPRYTVHALAAWSRALLEQPPEQMLPLLVAEAAQWLGIAPDAHYAAAHRWRYARMQACLDAAQLTLAPGLHYASDGCLGDGVESAHCSGRAAALALLDAAAPAESAS